PAAMSLTVCLAPANTIGYPQGGGHLWVYLNWALALRAAPRVPRRVARGPRRSHVALHDHHALVGRDVRVRRYDLFEREAGRLPRVRRSTVPDARTDRAGRVPGPAVRRVARAPRGPGLGRA